MSNTVFQQHKSQAIRNGWLSQDQRSELLRERYAKSALRKINTNDREELFKSIKKGQNKSGGTYGSSNEKVKMARTSTTFWNSGATLKAAS